MIGQELTRLSKLAALQAPGIHLTLPLPNTAVACMCHHIWHLNTDFRDWAQVLKLAGAAFTRQTIFPFPSHCYLKVLNFSHMFSILCACGMVGRVVPLWTVDVFSFTTNGSQGSNSGHQVWQQSPLPTQPSRWLILVFVQHFFLQGRKAQIQGTIQLAASLHFENCHVAQVGVEIPVFLFVLPRCMLESSSSMSVYICTTWHVLFR